jgi:hypothetical protein
MVRIILSSIKAQEINIISIKICISNQISRINKINFIKVHKKIRKDCKNCNIKRFKISKNLKILFSFKKNFAQVIRISKTLKINRNM